MDKALILTVLLMIATPLIVLTLGIGWLMFRRDKTNGDVDQGKCNGDSDISVYVCDGSRDRSGDNRRDKRMDAEEVINGLQDLRMALSRTEKEWLDYACDCVLRLEQLQKIASEVKRDDNND